MGPSGNPFITFLGLIDRAPRLSVHRAKFIHSVTFAKTIFPGAKKRSRYAYKKGISGLHDNLLQGKPTVRGSLNVGKVWETAVELLSVCRVCVLSYPYLSCFSSNFGFPANLKNNAV